MTRKQPHAYQCPKCGASILAAARHHVRQQSPCRACIRIANDWQCRQCGSSDPHHVFPCLEAAKA